MVDFPTFLRYDISPLVAKFSFCVPHRALFCPLYNKVSHHLIGMSFPPFGDNEIKTAVLLIEQQRSPVGGNSTDSVSQNIFPSPLTSSPSPPPPPVTSPPPVNTQEQSATATEQPSTPPPPHSYPNVKRQRTSRERRYRFDKSSDLTLLWCVENAGAHVARWAQTDAMFDNDDTFLWK